MRAHTHHAPPRTRAHTRAHARARLGSALSHDGAAENRLIRPLARPVHAGPVQRAHKSSRPRRRRRRRRRRRSVTGRRPQTGERRCDLAKALRCAERGGRGGRGGGSSRRSSIDGRGSARRRKSGCRRGGSERRSSSRCGGGRRSLVLQVDDEPAEAVDEAVQLLSLRERARVCVRARARVRVERDHVGGLAKGGVSTHAQGAGARSDAVTHGRAAHTCCRFLSESIWLRSSVRHMVPPKRQSRRTNRPSQSACRRRGRKFRLLEYPSLFNVEKSYCPCTG